MKKVLAINASPRRGHNTATLLQKALDGAAEIGVETKMIHLYELQYKGCISCFTCKRKDGKHSGSCIVYDELSPVLNAVMESDVLLIGSPIYLGNVTGMLRMFIERLIFSNLSYEDTSSHFKGKIDVGFIYTMNLSDSESEQRGYDQIFKNNQQYFQRILNGRSEWLKVCDTYQFDDYSKYAVSRFDVAHKEKVRAEQFPKDCGAAFDFGKLLVRG